MRALWIVFVWPEPCSSAAGYRTLELINILASRGIEVEVVSPCQDNQFRKTLESQKIKTHHFLPNESHFDEYIKNYDPDIVFFDRFMIEEQFSWRVKNSSPRSLRVLDTIDIHSLRKTRQKAIEEHRNINAIKIEEYFSDYAIREIASIYRSDVSLVISEFEYSFLQNTFSVPSSLLSLCKFSRMIHDHGKDFNERKNFVFIGNFNHTPNVDAARILYSSLWRKILSELSSHRINDAELHIYGAYPTKEIYSLHSTEMKITVKGFVSDLSEAFSSYRVNLSPLRFGAGIKGKIADGWSYGTPCCTTPLGAEGMHEDLPFGGIVSKSIDDFSHDASKLYVDRELWSTAHKNSIEIIHALYSPETILNKFLNSLFFHLENKEALRSKNFLGHMLWHQQFRATEYFSKWIEAKNKLVYSSTP